MSIEDVNGGNPNAVAFVPNVRIIYLMSRY